jgi:uncharacterized damage-inducible protein DinB
MRTTPWFERQFEFTTPISLFPPLLERLRGTPARIEERLRDLTPNVLRTRRENAWSIQENVGHLLDIEALWHGRLDDYESGCQILREADMENRRTCDARHNSRALQEILGGFRASRMNLVERLEGLDEAGAGRSATHPRLGQPMRIVDMVVFAVEHDDHHLARMTELIRAFAEGRRV